MTIAHDHIGISVSPDDLEPTIDWYAEHLGFTVAQRFETNGLLFAFLVSGTAKIELMAAASRHQTAYDDIFTTMDPSRLHHVALAVDDLTTLLADLQSQGVALIGGPMELEAIGQRFAFVTDNLGNILELTEPLI